MCAAGDSAQRAIAIVWSAEPNAYPAHRDELQRRPKQQRRLVFRLTHPPGVRRHVPYTGHQRARAPRRADRRRRHLRHRRGALPHARSTPTRRSRSSRRATPSAAPGTCSATPASAPTPTCTPSATSSSRGRTRRRSPAPTRSWTTCARRRCENGIDEQDPLPPQGAPRGLVERRGRWTRRGRAHRHRRAADDQLRLAVLRRRLLPLRRGLHAPSSRAVSGSAARSCTRSTGPRTSTTRGKRVVVIGSGATAVTLVPALAAAARRT